jgi:hypothetical protein
MSGTNRGVPTRYAGVTFRSRLEARWAVLFDTLKWHWSYEPVDLTFYIPDFALRFDAGVIAVEIKPVLVFDELRVHAQRIADAGWPGEHMVLGAELFNGTENTAIGAIGRPDAMGVFIDRGVVFTCLDCGQVSLRGDAESWACRMCGSDDGNTHVGDYPASDLRSAWLAAGNRVQWRAA